MLIIIIIQAFNRKTSFPLAPTAEIELTQENLLHNQFQSYIPRQNLDKFVSSVIQVLILFIIQQIE